MDHGVLVWPVEGHGRPPAPRIFLQNDSGRGVVYGANQPAGWVMRW